MKEWSADVTAEHGAPASLLVRACVRRLRGGAPYFAVVAALTYRGQAGPERFGQMPDEIARWLPALAPLARLSGDTYDPQNAEHRRSIAEFGLEIES